MRKFKLLSFIAVTFSAAGISAQMPPPPIPKAEAEIRDNSIKMRSMELERIKREAAKPFVESTGKEREIRFARIKKDFESIQKRQDSIIRIYTTGRKIDYAKIGEAAAEMTKDASRLDKNLFGAETDQTEAGVERKGGKQKSVRDLIIELDSAIADFVDSPVFNNSKVVNSGISEKAQDQLEQIIKLSRGLSEEAGRMN